MSLYDDLDVTAGGGAGTAGGAGGSSAAAGWSLPMQKTLLLQQQRRSQQLQQQQQQLQQLATAGGGGGLHQRSGSSGGGSVAASSSGPTLAPVVNLKGKRDGRGQTLIVGNLGAGVGGGEYRFNQRTGRMERAAAPVGAKSGVNDPTLSLGPDDDYNPFYPNEYDEVVGMVRAKRKLQELTDSEKQQQQQPQQHKQKQHRGAAAPSGPASSLSSASGAATAGDAAAAAGHDSDGSFHRSGSDTSDHESDHEEEDKKRRMGRGAYIAPPSSLLAQDAKQSAEPPAPPTPAQAAYLGASAKPTLAEKHNVSTAAANMMAKMGYRHGQGLGREGQGMASALSVEKTSKRGGKIVSELDRYKNPSLVIMLTNMVGPGDVDDELEGEIKDECQKYGPVVLVTIFELPRPNVPSEEAVRIFVEFERIDSAIKAMSELNGRFFGGRTVACRFYDTEKFRDLELEAQPLSLELNE